MTDWRRTTNRTPLEAASDKRAALKAAEAAGVVADSFKVRKTLMARVHAGEMSLAEAQAELARIKRGAKAAGMTTRDRVYREG